MAARLRTAEITGVHDPIYHRVLAMDDGREQFYLVSTDFCLFSPGLYDEVAAELKKQSGIDADSFWWSVTHTHSAPESGPHGVYDALLKGRSDHEWDREYTEHVKTSLIVGCPAGESETRTGETADRRWNLSCEYQSSSEGCRQEGHPRLNPDGPWTGRSA